MYNHANRQKGDHNIEEILVHKSKDDCAKQYMEIVTGNYRIRPFFLRWVSLSLLFFYLVSLFSGHGPHWASENEKLLVGRKTYLFWTIGQPFILSLVSTCRIYKNGRHL